MTLSVCRYCGSGFILLMWVYKQNKLDLRPLFLMLKVSKVKSFMYYEQKIKGYVRGVESGVCGCIQSNVTYVRGVESELFHVLCTENLKKVFGKLSNHTMYVRCVENGQK